MSDATSSDRREIIAADLGIDDETFKSEVYLYWMEYRDPTRSAIWNEGRCKELTPLFYQAWRQYKVQKEDLDDLVKRQRGVLNNLYHLVSAVCGYGERVKGILQ